MYFQGRSIRGVQDVAWLSADGQEMTDEAWNADGTKSLGVLLAGDGIEEVDEVGEIIVGDSLLVLLNAHDESVPFTLPGVEPDQYWTLVLDTAGADATDHPFKAGGSYPLQGQSLAVFKLTPPLRERRRAAQSFQDATAEFDAQRKPSTSEPVEAVGVDH
jgi:glycogen operon protein